MFFFYKHDTSNGAFTYYVISFSQIFDSPSPICDQALSLSSPPPSIMSTLNPHPFPKQNISSNAGFIQGLWDMWFVNYNFPTGFSLIITKNIF